MGRKLFAVVVGITLVVAGFLYVKNSEPEAQKPQASPDIGARVGKNSPVFTLANLEGEKVTVGQPGKITVINFWATWCPPCQEEMPELDLFAKKNQQKINFYAINLQESNGKVSEFMNKSKYTMPVLLDKDGIVAKQFQVAAIPTTIIINKTGIIKHRQSGAMTMNELDGIINSM